MKAQRVKVFDWSEERARRREPMRVIDDAAFDLPDDHDAARRALRALLVARYGGKVRSVHAMVPAGLTATVER